MKFITVKEQLEIDIGAGLPTSTVGRWVNSAQIEIAKRYGTRTRYWYPPVLATLPADIGPAAVDMVLNGAINMPEPPVSVIIGDGGLYEVITYQTADHIGIYDITRGDQGTTALDWPSGTELRALPVSSTEYDLPADILTLHEVRSQTNQPIFKYHATPDRKISVFAGGMYYINYTRVPVPIDTTDAEAVLEVHPVFENDVVTFCLSRYWQGIAEAIPGEENKAQILMSEFVRSVEASAKHLNRIENQQYTIGFELW